MSRPNYLPWEPPPYIVLAIVMFVMLVVGGVFAYFQIQECTRVHPLWYCLTT